MSIMHAKLPRGLDTTTRSATVRTRYRTAVETRPVRHWQEHRRQRLRPRRVLQSALDCASTTTSVGVLHSIGNAPAKSTNSAAAPYDYFRSNSNVSAGSASRRTWRSRCVLL
jgi:hypothetical protein